MAGSRRHDRSVGTSGWAALWARLRSLQVQIVLWTILPIAIFLLGLSWADLYGHQQEMRVMVEERNKVLVRAMADRIAEDLANDAGLLQAVGDGEAFRQADAPTQARLLAPLGDVYQAGIVLLDREGSPRAETGAAASWSRAAFVAPLAQAASQRQQPAFVAVPHEGLPPLHLAVAVPLTDGQGALVGVLPLSQSVIAGAIDSLQSSPEVQAVLLTSRDEPVYRVGPASPEARAEEAVVVTTVDVPGTDWRVVLSEPWHRLLPLVLRYAQATALVAAAAVFISLLAVYFGVRYVTQPLQALEQEARRMAWGNFPAVKDPVGGVEEIVNLQRTLRQMAAQVRSYQTAMRSYVAAVTEAQEEERVRLARELHDDTVQSLIALGQRLERLQKAKGQPTEALHRELAALRQATRDLVQDVRRLIGDLRPVYLDDLGLVPALEMLVRRATPAHQAELEVGGAVRRLPADLELAVYRLVQAALRNVEQHAQARHVRLRLDFEPEGVRVVVEDDGAGFVVPSSPDELAREGHFGLLGMRERATLHGGWLDLTSQPGRGTRLEVYLPSTA